MRYADDVTVYVGSERAAQRVMASITQHVEQRLKLKVNRQKSAVDLARKRALLGFRFFGRQREARVRVDPDARKRAKDRLRQLTSRKWGVSMERRIEEINRFTIGWTAYFALADTPSVFEGLDEWCQGRLKTDPLGAWVRKVAGPGGWRACAARAGATTRVSVLAVQLGGAAGRVLRGLTGALAARSGRGGSHPLGMRASPPLR